MAVITYSVKKIESIAPVLDAFGRSARLAEVTRHYTKDTETDVITESGASGIELLWGKTRAQVVASMRADAAAFTARSDALLADAERIENED